MKIINIHYPYITGNHLCDGKTHRVKPIKLEQLENNLFILHYYDLAHKTPCITLLRRTNNIFKKIPLKEYNQLIQLMRNKRPLKVVNNLFDNISDIYSEDIVYNLYDCIKKDEEIKPTPYIASSSGGGGDGGNNPPYFIDSNISTDEDKPTLPSAITNIPRIDTSSGGSGGPPNEGDDNSPSKYNNNLSQYNSENKYIFVAINFTQDKILRYGNISSGLTYFCVDKTGKFINISNIKKKHEISLLLYLKEEIKNNNIFTNRISNVIIDNVHYKFVASYKQVASATKQIITNEKPNNNKSASLILEEALTGKIDSLCFGTLIIDKKIVNVYNLKKIIEYDKEREQKNQINNPYKK